VIPPALVEQVADSEQLAADRKLVGRVEATTAKLADSRAAHAKAVETDKQAEQAFVQGARAKLPEPAAPAAEQAVGQAGRELELLTRQLPASADRVFELAHPHADEALQRLESLADEGEDESRAISRRRLRRSTSAPSLDVRFSGSA
jgi:hypothetical protein